MNNIFRFPLKTCCHKSCVGAVHTNLMNFTPSENCHTNLNDFWNSFCNMLIHSLVQKRWVSYSFIILYLVLNKQKQSVLKFINNFEKYLIQFLFTYFRYYLKLADSIILLKIYYNLLNISTKMLSCKTGIWVNVDITDWLALDLFVVERFDCIDK